MPKPVRSNIYTYQIGNTQSIGRTYNFINARNGGLGPAFFWNNYYSSFREGPPIPPTPVIPKIIVRQKLSVIVRPKSIFKNPKILKNPNIYTS